MLESKHIWCVFHLGPTFAELDVLLQLSISIHKIQMELSHPVPESDRVLLRRFHVSPSSPCTSRVEIFNPKMRFLYTAYVYCTNQQLRFSHNFFVALSVDRYLHHLFVQCPGFFSDLLLVILGDTFVQVASPCPQQPGNFAGVKYICIYIYMYVYMYIIYICVYI